MYQYRRIIDVSNEVFYIQSLVKLNVIKNKHSPLYLHRYFINDHILFNFICLLTTHEIN